MLSLLALLSIASPCDVTTATVGQLLGLVACRSHAPYTAAEQVAAHRALKLSLSAAPTQLKNGEYTTLTLVVQNPTDLPVVLLFSRFVHNEMYFVTATTETGVAVVPPGLKPPEHYVGGACDPDRTPDPEDLAPPMRITLLPGARITDERSFTAEGLRWGKPNICGHHFIERAGKLKPGRYRLTCGLPVVGDPFEASTVIEVNGK
jgi:hypothetical protein